DFPLVAVAELLALVVVHRRGRALATTHELLDVAAGAAGRPPVETRSAACGDGDAPVLGHVGGPPRRPTPCSITWSTISTCPSCRRPALPATRSERAFSGSMTDTIRGHGRFARAWANTQHAASVA